jgi:hypothetical protein
MRLCRYKIMVEIRRYAEKDNPSNSSSSITTR